MIVPESSGCPSLTKETLACLVAPGQLQPQCLQGNFPIQLRVLGPEHYPHAACPDRLQQTERPNSSKLTRLLGWVEEGSQFPRRLAGGDRCRCVEFVGSGYLLAGAALQPMEGMQQALHTGQTQMSGQGVGGANQIEQRVHRGQTGQTRCTMGQPVRWSARVSASGRRT